MQKFLKNLIFIAVPVLMLAGGFFIGYFIHSHLHWLGVNFIQVGDIIACYAVPMLLCGGFGIALGDHLSKKI